MKYKIIFICKLAPFVKNADKLIFFKISVLARQGSGSACRSVYGGFVRWRMGMREDGFDSRAEVIQPATHWPDIRALILVATDARKKVNLQLLIYPILCNTFYLKCLVTMTIFF